MSLPVPPELIERAVLRFERESRESPEAPARTPRAITISRQLGCGGRRIAEALARQLGWPLWDKEILPVLATGSGLHYPARMFEAVDERHSGAIDDAAYAMLGGVSKHVYLHLLPRAILAAAQQDAIILGRGAHLLLPEALKVRVEAPVDRRIENMVRFEGMTRRVARERIETSDRERAGFLRELAARLSSLHPHRPEGLEYDLTINTARFSVQQATELILSAAAQRFDLEADRSLVGASGRQLAR